MLVCVNLPPSPCRCCNWSKHIMAHGVGHCPITQSYKCLFCGNPRHSYLFVRRDKSTCPSYWTITYTYDAKPSTNGHTTVCHIRPLQGLSRPFLQLKNPRLPFSVICIVWALWKASFINNKHCRNHQSDRFWSEQFAMCYNPPTWRQ